MEDTLSYFEFSKALEAIRDEQAVVVIAPEKGHDGREEREVLEQGLEGPDPLHGAKSVFDVSGNEHMGGLGRSQPPQVVDHLICP